jgi:hypothetical protein
VRRPVLALAAVLAAAPAHAQIGAPGPPGPFAIDFRALTMAVPGEPAFFPPVPSGTVLPTRGFGFELGGHVYLMRVAGGRLGIGAEVVRLSAGTSPPAPAVSPTSVPPPRTIPDVGSTVTIMSPQLSLNFGTGTGWSYVSAGYGFAGVRTTTSGVPRMADAERESGRLRDINIGGGARWFFRGHLGFSFDIRMHMIAGSASEVPRQPIPASRLIAAAVGISLR